MKKYTLEFEKPILELDNKITELETLAQNGKIGLESEIRKLRKKAEKTRRDVYSSLSRWQRVLLARHPNRPYALDYIDRICADFIELHGDRNFRDDKAIVSGLAHLGPYRVAIIGQQKGRGTKDNLERNFAMPHPEGYRKALRIMKIAERFNMPVITLIDTPGAYPGLGAEERGQASAIAVNLKEMAQLRVPIIAVIIGEGGSGGALALGVADRVYMLEYAIYSVISPEGCASILYRDASFAQKAAEAMKLTAPDLFEYKLVDGLIKEPVGGAHNDFDEVAANLSETLISALNELVEMDPDQRLLARIDKFAAMGIWQEE